MSGATAALWTFVATVILALASLVPRARDALAARIDKDRTQTEHDRQMLELALIRARREAAFDAAATVETRKDGGALTGAEKLATAVELANATTPATITVTSADVEAALPRVRASLATPTSSYPPPAGGGKPWD